MKIFGKLQIEKHIKAAKTLSKIMNSVFEYIRKTKKVSEKEVSNFILDRFKEFELKSDKDVPIVAFAENTSFKHYFPDKDSKVLEKNSVIMVDIWARLKEKNSPYADITWMAYYGKIPDKVKEAFNVVIQARNKGVFYIKKELNEGRIPRGFEVDKVVRNTIDNSRFVGKFIHGTGHCIGFNSPHGSSAHLNSKGKTPLKINLGYTIEPGIYLEKEFGVRSEINFYINRNKKVMITTKIQDKIIKI